jgi:hypothetical protein
MNQTQLIEHNNNHKYLCYTILLLIFPLLFFYQKMNVRSREDYVFALLLVMVIISSQLFWHNPIKNSQIHKVDSIIAKITIFTFILYILIYKFKFSFIFVLLAIIISYYFSDHHSKQSWVSNEHIFFHGLLHIFCFIATLYMFNPNIT